MKVWFKLNREQQARAEIAIREYAESVEMYWEQSWFNTDQRLWLEGAVLKYEGQRCPFVQDGACGAVKQALGNGPVTVVKYETNDARLKWDETLSGYMQDRASLDEVLAHARKRNSPWLVEWYKNNPNVRAYARYIGETEARLAAQFDAVLCANVRRIRFALKEAQV